MHIVLSGACPLVKLRLGTTGELDIGFSSECTAAYSEPNTESLSLHFSGHYERSSSLQWVNRRLPGQSKGLVLNSLELQCENTRVELENYELAAEFRLSIAGNGNTLQIWRLNGMRLKLEASGHHNSVSFIEAQLPLQEVCLSLTGFYNQIKDLWLLGCSLSSISVANCSVVIAALEPDTDERCFEFSRDENSQILVYLPNEGKRQVLSAHELWSFDSTLLNICTHPRALPPPRQRPLPTETAELASEQQRIICGVCRTAAPDRLLQPCGHLFFCGDCFERSPEHSTDHCPVCRGTVRSVQRIIPVVGC